MICQVLNERYEIKQQLGKKAARRTLLAQDLQTQDLVVIKLLIFSPEFEWDDLKLFEREAEILRHLDHSKIPSYIDSFEVDLPTYKGFALVQTYIEAQSLEDYLQAGRTFNEEEIKQLAKSLLQILRYLHGQNPPVIHRDIKPSNILLANRSGHSIGEVYLVDFGSVQTLTVKKSETITIVGTYGYMPPEQFGGRTVPASDLYSLGATLICLGTGIHAADLPQKDGRFQFEKIVILNPRLIHWLKRLTEPNLDKRFNGVEEAENALNNIINSLIDYKIEKKPYVYGSKIKLNKTHKKLEIILPKNWTIEAIFIEFWLIVGLLIFSYLTFWSFAYGGIILGFIILSFLLRLWYGFIKGFSPGKISINQDKIFFFSKFLFLKIPIIKPSPRKEISKIERNRISFAIIKVFDEEISEYIYPLKEFPPSLVIYAGKFKYEIKAEKGITEPELDWLASELCEWLGLPLTQSE